MFLSILHISIGTRARNHQYCTNAINSLRLCKTLGTSTEHSRSGIGRSLSHPRAARPAPCSRRLLHASASPRRRLADSHGRALAVNMWRGVPAFLKGSTTCWPCRDHDSTTSPASLAQARVHRQPGPKPKRNGAQRAEHQTFEHAPGTRPPAAEAAMGGLERSLASEQNRARGSDSLLRYACPRRPPSYAISPINERAGDNRCRRTAAAVGHPRHC